MEYVMKKEVSRIVRDLSPIEPDERISDRVAIPRVLEVPNALHYLRCKFTNLLFCYDVTKLKTYLNCFLR